MTEAVGDTDFDERLTLRVSRKPSTYEARVVQHRYSDRHAGPSRHTSPARDAIRSVVKSGVRPPPAASRDSEHPSCGPRANGATRARPVGYASRVSTGIPLLRNRVLPCSAHPSRMITNRLRRLAQEAPTGATRIAPKARSLARDNRDHGTDRRTSHLKVLAASRFHLADGASRCRQEWPEARLARSDAFCRADS
jgi:hypothetical protein